MRYLLSEHSAAILRALGAGRGGVSFEDRRIASPPGVPKLMPFDVRIAPGGEGHEDETHAYCWLPADNRGSIVWFVGCEGYAHHIVLPGQVYDATTGWLDLGEVEPGQFVVLGCAVSNSSYAQYGEAAPLYDATRYFVRIEDNDLPLDNPSGYTIVRDLTPPRTIAQCGPNGLRQLFHGVYSVDADMGDERLDGTAWSTSHIRTESVTKRDYEGPPGVVSLHGFRAPTTISNPYPDGSTPEDDNDLLLLVRKRASDGKSAELVYLKLASVAASSGGGGTTPPPDYQDILDDHNERIQIPCPSDGKGDTALWDPCAQQWKSGRTMADVLAFILAAKFWPVNGDFTKCRGGSIGDTNGSKVIDLDYKTLVGAWTASGPRQGQSGNALYVDGNFQQANGTFYVGSTPYVGIDLVVNGERYRFLANDMGPA